MLASKRTRSFLAVTMLVILVPVARAQSGIGGEWHFDEGVGQSTADSSGNANDGQLGSTSGADTNDPVWATGSLGNALNYAGGRVDSGGDYVRIPDSSALESPEVTVEAWVRAPSSPGKNRYIVAKGIDACRAASYALYTHNFGLRFYIYDGSAFVHSPDAGTGVWNGDWHHVAGVFDGSAVRLYVDGVEVSTGIPTSRDIAYGLPTGDDLYIGNYDQMGTCGHNFGFVGDIDEVTIWTRALSPIEIAQRAQRNPADLLSDLVQDIVDLNLQSGIASSLDAKLAAAMKALQDVNQNNNIAAIKALNAFIAAVQAQSGSLIPPSVANDLIADAQAIIELLLNGA